MNESSSQQPLPQPSGSGLPPSTGSSPSIQRPQGSSIGSGTQPLAGDLNLPSDPQQTVISSRPPVTNLHLGSGLTGEAASLWEGEQLGQFILKKFVGGGGMGIVFRALDTTLDREVAVKVLSRDQSTDEETLRRFRNEAQSAARLNHENIARVFYVGEDRGVHYIVFEFIEGVNIRDLVEQQGPLPLPQALSYCYQIALALDHACQRSVIHRDIKPSNVLVTPDGKAKLVDMGLARLNLMAQATDDLTASGVTLGTFDYISPEQARDPRSADVRSDLYSLGCSFYFMLTGRPPFPDGTVLQKLLQHQGDSPPDPRSVRPELPSQVSRILAKLLAKNPAERYQQPGDLIESLVSLGQSLGIALGEAPLARLPQPVGRTARWQQHLPWAVPVAALFLIVLALDYYWARGPQDQGPTWAVSPQPPAATLPNRPVTPPPQVREQPIDGLPAKGDSSNSSPRTMPSPAASPTTAPLRESPRPDDSAKSLPQAETPEMPERSSSDPFGVFDFVERFQAKIRDEQERLRARAAASDDVDLSAGELPTPPTAIATQASREILTVGDDSLPNNYTSLLAACSAAKDGDVIELHFDGRRAERPMALSNVKLTIRAAENHRPVVVFAPEADKPYARTQMVSVSGGQLSVQGVHWELDLPANSPSERSLFETQHADQLEFEDCTFTVRGQPPYYGSVAVFDIKAPPGAASMDMGGASMEGHVVNIHLDNCLVRGEATLLRDSDVQAVRLTWNDGLLATSERLLVTEGSALQSRQEPRLEINLRHVTVMAASGLVLMTNGQEEPHQLVVDFRCHDCILASTGSAALVEQRGSAGIEDFMARFLWSGDSIFFTGFGSFWKVMNSSGPIGSKEYNFDQWRERWQFTSRNQYAGPTAVAWSNAPPGGRPFHAQLASDYVLDASAGSAATNRTSDGQDAGAPLAFLPVPSERPAAVSPAEAPPRLPPPFGPPMPTGMDE